MAILLFLHFCFQCQNMHIEQNSLQENILQPFLYKYVKYEASTYHANIVITNSYEVSTYHANIVITNSSKCSIFLLLENECRDKGNKSRKKMQHAKG